MKPKYFQSDTSHRDRWMVSYLDAMTILLIFFVSVAARSAPAHVKAAEPPPPPPPAPKIVDARPPVNPLAERLKQTGLDVRREPRGFVISLPQKILFPSGGDQIGPNAYPVIEQIAGILRDVPNPVILIGHADSVPIHTRRFKNNWELSAARGLRLLEVLNQRYGIDESRMSVSSEGANQPAEPNDTAEGRAGNRRVEIVILQQPEA